MAIDNPVPTNPTDLNNVNLDTVQWNVKAHRVTSMGGFSVPEYDELSLTYVTSGNGLGQIETVVYLLSSTPVLTLTLSYDANDNLIGVARS